MEATMSLGGFGTYGGLGGPTDMGGGFSVVTPSHKTVVKHPMFDPAQDEHVEEEKKSS
jgi:hypothetical protein